MTFWGVLPEVALKVSLVVLLALAVVWCLRRRSAAARHWVLSVAVGCAFAVPVLSALAPTWHVPVAQPWSVTVPTAVRFAGETDTLVQSGETTLDPNATLGNPAAGPRRGRRPSTARLMLPIWIIGVAGLGAALLLGLVRLAWLSAGATAVTDPRWLEQVARTAARLGLRRPVRLLQSDHPTLLATWGLLWPKVMVPAGAQAWNEDRIRVVLAHELAHIRRGDWAVQLGADVLRTLFWFNPLMWVATRCLRRDSELACDDTVLGLGVDGSEYATQLLDLAKALRSPALALSPGMAMARPSGLERRITAMMNPTLRRQPFLRRSRLGVIAAALAVTIPLAVLAQSGPGTVSGTIVDSTGQPWAGSRVTLSSAGLDKEETTLRTMLDRSEVVREARTIVFRGHAELGDTDPQATKERTQRELEDADGVVRIKREVAVRRSLGEDADVAFLHLDRARWSTRSDDVGRFEIADVPPGDYRLAVHLPGFASVEEHVTVEAGQRLQRQIALEVGSIEETDTVAASDPAPVPTSTSATTHEEQRQRIGDGPLQPPIKPRSLTPAYPDVLRASGAQGTVILEALVAADGSFQVLNVLTPVDPDLLTPVQPELARAAVAAARQWQFEPTRLHGLPVDTRMKVTVHFTDES